MSAREHPILMSGAMVRAILDGRKTQTRRIVTTRHPVTCIGSSDERDDPSSWGYFFDGPDHNGYMVLGRGHDEREDHGRISIPCPYGAPGDRLWVRETWCLAHPDYHTEEEGERLGRPMRDGRWCHYAATDDVDENDGRSPWRPSIHMPRWASRLTLEVAAIRVQRLQEITDEDTRAEGVTFGEMQPAIINGEPGRAMIFKARDAFAYLWNAINGDRALWSSNPWVWAVTFRRAA